MSSCLPAELRRALLAQVCCGIPELCEFLDCEVELLWECQDHCNDRLRYIYTQLGLIEAAQIFARNKIDTMTREASSQMQERFTAFSSQKSEAERDASGRSCSWAAATSSQFFNRDSEDQGIGWSDYRHKYTSELLNNGFDRSCRHTFGYSFHKTKVVGRHDGFWEERGRSNSLRDYETEGGTDDLVPLSNFQWDEALVSLSAEPPFVVVNQPDDPMEGQIIPPSDGWDVCPPPPQDYMDPQIVNVAPCKGFRANYPSMGTGKNGTLSFSVAFPTVGSVSTTWSVGSNKRQYYHCVRTMGGANSQRSHESTDIDTGSTDASEDDNQSYSNENSTTYHLVRKYGIITRRATTDNDAEEKSEGYSTGLANSESARDAKSTAYSQQRAEAQTVRHSESHFLRTERANNDMISQKFGQIGVHLSNLWDRVWAHLNQLERQQAARPYGGKMNCPRESKSCLPVRRSWHALNRVVPHV